MITYGLQKNMTNLNNFEKKFLGISRLLISLDFTKNTNINHIAVWLLFTLKNACNFICCKGILEQFAVLVKSIESNNIKRDSKVFFLNKKFNFSRA